MPLHGRYPEPDGFKVDATYTYWVSCSRQAYTQNIQNASVSLSIGRGIDLTGEHLRVVLSIHNLKRVANQQTLKFKIQALKVKLFA